MNISRFKSLSPHVGLRVYVAAFLIYVVFGLSTLPILNGDTDLWYHLNGGRYIAAHGEIANSSFFSFLEPARHFSNYYWLFQLLNYKIHLALGNTGLIALRAMLFCLISAALFGVFRVRSEGITPFFVLMLTMYIMLLLPRSLLNRPHVFSYLFIAVFVYVYEIRPQRAYILPVIALLWVNLHGVEYPVMLLICGAYMAEVYVRRLRRKTAFTKDELMRLASGAACMGAIYLSPHGAALLSVPFTDTRYASVYINELREMTAVEFLSFNVTEGGISYISIFNVMLVLTLSGLTSALSNNKLRMSHLGLLLGGAYLLTKGARFRSEFALLVMPVVGSALPIDFNHAAVGGLSKWLRNTAAAVILSVPFIFVHYTLNDSPVLARQLPHGVVSFLKHVKAMPGNGRVMNHPNSGGYLQWELYPRYKIAMDMEAPFLFSDFDFYNIHMSYQDETVFRKFAARYRPSYITVPRQYGAFKEIIAKFPEYQPVFFDDAEVLYSRQPDVVSLYSIKAVNPFAPEISAADNATVVMAELNKISSIDPNIDAVVRTIAQIKINEGKYDEAVQYAQRLINSSPDLPVGYYLRGDALIGKQEYAAALKSFKIAMGRTPDAMKSPIYRKLWECRFKMKQDKESYQALSKAVDVFSPQTPYTDLYQLGLAALDDGDIERAHMLFMAAYEKLPLAADNASLFQWEQKIKKMLTASGGLMP
ncbi:MAG: hypothetical protein HQK97_02430 [Nitrospirae bacterium]|nr:hypothetical protein [Nitrospirota bacterium]